MIRLHIYFAWTEGLSLLGLTARMFASKHELLIVSPFFVISPCAMATKIAVALCVLVTIVLQSFLFQSNRHSRLPGLRVKSTDLLQYSHCVRTFFFAFDLQNAFKNILLRV